MSQQILTKLAGALALVICLASCSTPPPPKDLSQDSIIPLPESLTATGSSYVLTNETVIYTQKGSTDLTPVAKYLAEMLNPATGFDIKWKSVDEAPKKGIYLTLEQNGGAEECYTLDIQEKHITIAGNSPAGVFYGIQTLRQLLPAAIEKSSVQQEAQWLVATGKITDKPTYGYRGAMLDVSRHFFSVADVKRYIDLIALYKMNRLHLHLSDDQGWRIEIKSWPKLTEIGGKSEVGGGEGGFYTQEQYKDIVKYAQDRYVTIVPEIDMPGHTNAALSAYPELNCDGKATKPYTGIEVGFSTLCTDKEITYQFIDDVIRELAALTPGEYIHIGGDESHVTAMEDYIPFIERAQQIVTKHGKKSMGWDEIAHAKLEQNTIAQWWSKVENAKMAVEQGAKVLVSPATNAYLDMQYDSTTHLGLHWAGYTEVDDAYQWDAVEIAKGIPAESIIGIEAPLWTETVTNMDELEYLVFPRLPGLAEIGWTPKQNRNWETYKVRLGKQKARFEALEIDYYASKRVPWQ